MNRYETLVQRMQHGEQILIDGATGTEVERRGVPQIENAWNGGGALSHPDIVRQIHIDYINAGAEIIISNTFSTARHIMRDAGFEEQFEAVNRRSVELAVEARKQTGKEQVLVAGGLSHWAWVEEPTLDELRSNMDEQVAIMAEAGAELFMLEMMINIDRMQVLIEAAKATGRPVWAGLSCDLDDEGNPKLWNKGTLSEAISMLNEYEIPMINIMHTDVTNVNPCLELLAKEWDGLVGVYAHSGLFVDGKWIFNSVISPEDYASEAAGWLKQDINLVGGCCGIGVEHIHLLKTMI